MVTKRKAANAVISAPFGRLGVWADERGVSMIDLLDARTGEKLPDSPLAAEVVRQLNLYFKNPRHIFSVPLAEQGTVFQKTVWKKLRAIPAGRTQQYGEIAAGLATSPRAIGGACRSNPIPIITPCHRVVSRTDTGGYMGQLNGVAIKMKQWLLQHEANG